MDSSMCRTRKTVATFQRNDCRWPIGDPKHPDFHFCGAPKLPGRPYCPVAMTRPMTSGWGETKDGRAVRGKRR